MSNADASWWVIARLGLVPDQALGPVCGPFPSEDAAIEAAETMITHNTMRLVLITKTVAVATPSLAKVTRVQELPPARSHVDLQQQVLQTAGMGCVSAQGRVK